MLRVAIWKTNNVNTAKKKGVMEADSVETLGVDLRTRVKRLGAKEKARRKRCKSEILAHQEEQSLPKEPHEGGVKKLSRKGMVPARTWRILAEGLAPTERFI